MPMEILKRVQNDKFQAFTDNAVMPNPESVMLNLIQHLFRASLFRHLIEIFWFFIPIGIFG